MKIHENLQQRSPEWFALRLGKITGTRLKKVMSANNLDLIDELIAEDLSQTIEESFTSGAMQRGVDCEPLAMSDYQDTTGNNVKEIGFIEGEYMMGLSPDGLVMENGKYVGAVEIKCPNTKTHVNYIRLNRMPSAYKYQIFMYFIVVDTLEWLDFVSWDDRLSVAPMHIIRIKREDILSELAEAETKIEEFIAKKDKYLDKVLELKQIW